MGDFLVILMALLMVIWWIIFMDFDDVDGVLNGDIYGFLYGL